MYIRLPATVATDNKYDFYHGGVLNETREKQLFP